MDDATESIDCVIVLDVTSSMGPWLSSAKKTALDIAQEVNDRYPGATFRLGVSAYRDFGDGAEQYVTIPLTADINNVRAALAPLVAKGGDDDAEDVAGGLRNALAMPWTAPTRVVIHVADDPAHGAKFHGIDVTDRYPKGWRTYGEPTAEKYIADVARAGIDYYFIRITNRTDKMLAVFHSHYTAAAMAAGKEGDVAFALLDLAIDGYGARGQGSAGGGAAAAGGGGGGGGVERPPWSAADGLMPAAVAPPGGALRAAAGAAVAELDAPAAARYAGAPPPAVERSLAGAIPEALRDVCMTVLPSWALASPPPPPPAAPAVPAAAAEAEEEAADLAKAVASSVAVKREMEALPAPAAAAAASASAGPSVVTSRRAAMVRASAMPAMASLTASPAMGAAAGGMFAAPAAAAAASPTLAAPAASFATVDDALCGVVTSAIFSTVDRRRGRVTTSSATPTGAAAASGGAAATTTA